MHPLFGYGLRRSLRVCLHRAHLATFAAVCLAFSLRSKGLAQDRFEIQVYDSQTAPPGQVGLELHANAVARGSREPLGPELPTQGVVHLTFEPHLGLLSWCEVGAYLQTAQRPDGQFDAAGAKLRFKARAPTRYGGFGFAVNAELSDVPQRYEANQLGAELRPIADFAAGPWYAAVNPILGLDLKGAQAFQPQFEPAVKVGFQLDPALLLGAEYYGAFSSAASHLVYGAFDFTSRWIDLNAGVGYGFAGPERWVLKAILGIHPPEERP